VGEKTGAIVGISVGGRIAVGDGVGSGIDVGGTAVGSAVRVEATEVATWFATWLGGGVACANMQAAESENMTAMSSRGWCVERGIWILLYLDAQNYVVNPINSFTYRGVWVKRG
jgi:hypothetical protein